MAPDGVTILKVVDLNLPLPLALVWRRDNLSPLLARFVADLAGLVKRAPQRAIATRRSGT